MSLDHYGQSIEFKSTLTYLNILFIGVFTIEFIMKFLALHFKYFKIGMNIFDLIILVSSIFDIILEIYFSIPIVPTILRVVRLLKLGRIIRLTKHAKGIQAILLALIKSLPALVNIGLLLCLIIYIFAIFGMNLFMNVGHSNTDIGVTNEFNFENIYRSILTLFPLCTSAGWSVLLDALSSDGPPFCDPNITTTSQLLQGDCGNSFVAIPFLVIFVIVTFFVIINMYVAVILDNFSEAKEDCQKGLTDEDFDLFYRVWQRFDANGTEYINCDQLSNFADSLIDGLTINVCCSKKKKEIIYESPLRVHKPNEEKLSLMNIILCENNLVHCQDILQALTNNYLEKNQLLDNGFRKLIICHLTKRRPANYKPIGIVAI